MWTVFAFSEHQDRYVDCTLFTTDKHTLAKELHAWLSSIGWRVGIRQQGGK